jgi:alpha-L-rhamnosidase
VYAHCYDKHRQLFSDTPEKRYFSQHANVLAILTDAIPRNEQPALMKRILSDKSLTRCTLYFNFYLMHALKKAGMADQYLEHLDVWKQMLAEGLTTFPEKAENPRSDCHAWSSSPMIEFLATVCGIEPAEPGFKSVKIQPYLGKLKEANGVIPHPLGSIEVKLKRKGAKGVTAEIKLPEGLTGTFLWNNEKIALKGGSQTISR